MATFTLSRGTIVKHGTTSDHLRAILTAGLVPGAGRHELRGLSEHSPETTHGVYVGNLMAYFGATVAFGAASHALQLRVGPMGQVPSEVKDDVVVPVVLEIELKEDCELWADEDFVMFAPGSPIEYSPERLRAEAAPVWSKFQSGSVVREGGIPAEWITRFEHPLLWVPPGDATPRGGKWRQLVSDAHVMVYSHIQNYEKATPEQCWSALRGISGLVDRLSGFSQSLPFSAEGLERFFRFDTLASAKRAYAYMCTLHLLFQQIAEEVGVGGIRT